MNEINRTREWWDTERDRYACFISQVVMEELRAGEYPAKDKCLGLIEGMALLAVTPEIMDIAAVYQTKKLMPKNPAADSMQLALASFYRMDYLLTWTCRHLANATKVRHPDHLNQSMGLSIPVLATPHMLQLGEWSS